MTPVEQITSYFLKATHLNIFLLSVTATRRGILVGFDWMDFVPQLYKTKIKSLLIAWAVQTFPCLIIKYFKFRQQNKNDMEYYKIRNWQEG